MKSIPRPLCPLFLRLVLVAAPLTATAAEGAPNPSDTGAAVDAPTRTEVPARAVFAERAWKLEVDQPSLLPSMPRPLTYRITVVDGMGQTISPEEIQAAALDNAARADLQRASRGWVRPATLGVSLGLSLLPVGLGVAGAVAGGLLGAVVGFLIRNDSDGGVDSRAQYLPAVLMGAAGLTLGGGFAAVMWVPLAFLVTQMVAPLVEPPDVRKATADAVRRHNTDVAKDMGLDATTLEPQYFPRAG